MGDLYASAIGTRVLQLKEIPQRPAEYDGMLCLFDLKEGVDEELIRGALKVYGEITSRHRARARAKPIERTDDDQPEEVGHESDGDQ